MKPKVSIIVLTYWHEQYIRKALDTILTQKFDEPFEIIITDDASTDNTVNIAREYEAKYPKMIRVIVNEENLGISRNLYNALLQCRGEYIVLTAGDDYWLCEDKLQRQSDFLDENADYIAECTVTEMVDTKGELIGQSTPKKEYWDKDFNRDTFLKREYFSDAGIMVRNIFRTEDVQNKFKKMYEFSRDIDDLTFDFFLFDYGKLHISGYKAYALTIRSESDVGQRNYNTKYKGISNAIEHVKLISKLDAYYNYEFNFLEWYRPYFAEMCYYAIKKGQLWGLKYLAYIPVRFWMNFIIGILKGYKKD